MATTVNSVMTVQGDSHKAIHLDLTAGGGDTSVTYTLPVAGTSLAHNVVGFACWNQTTGALNTASSTYAPTTGVLTITCANSDHVRAVIFIAES